MQYSFVAGQGIQVTGLINNVSPQAKFLEIPQLDSEKSTNYTIGLGGKIAKNISFTVDYYNIRIKDRIILSTDISGTEIDDNGINIGTTPLDDILRSNNLNSVSFFINGLDSKTSGLDVVLSYKNISLGTGILDLNLSGNYTIENEIDGNVKNPALVESGGQSVFDETLESSIFTSRPETKWILGASYKISDFNISLNNTYFGKAIFKDPGLSSDLRTEFIPKIVTDLGVHYNATEKLALSLNVNNILNVLPEWKFTAENEAGQNLIDDTTVNEFGITPIQKQSNLVTFNQRYSQTTYFGYHFSQLGTLFNLSVNYKF
ncbi:hypothetical protein AB832_01250 [Flavobacteriaceae bacterium (ex Bugula neritina AB1)]|nr:hypothetical protein AB832_01250 [Flavobacteriaceae bacterium (ex Bugula neritina AB1)]